MRAYFLGVTDCMTGFRLILRNGLRRYVIIPLLINSVLFGAAIYFTGMQIDAWVDALLPDWLSFLEYVLWPLFVVTILLIVFYSFTLVANLIAAPFNSMLAARAEEVLGGRAHAALNTASFMNLVLRSVAAELTKLLYFLKWLIPLLVITFIPGINIIAPFAWFVFAAWTFALEYSDYTLANHGKLFPAVREFNRQHRLRALGFGGMVFVLTSIPFVNFLAMPVAVCGAARLVVKVDAASGA